MNWSEPGPLARGEPDSGSAAKELAGKEPTAREIDARALWLDLQSQNQILRTCLQGVGSAVFSVDGQYRCTSFNGVHASSMKVLYGAEIEVGKSLLDRQTVEGDRAKTKANLDRALGGEVVIEGAYSGDRTGPRLHFEVTYHPIRNEGDECVGVAVIAENVSQCAHDLGALADRERRFQALFEQAGVGIVEVDSTTGRFLQVNQRFCEMVGYSKEELLESSFQPLIHPEDLAASQKLMPDLRNDLFPDSTLEKRYIRKDGEIVWVSIQASKMILGHGFSGSHIHAVQDITARKAAEGQLKVSQAETQRMLENAEQSRHTLLNLVEDQRIAEEKIRRLNAELERRVVDRTRELASTNQELEAFAYSVSHDLRAPLRHMDGFLSMLARHLGDSLDGKGLHYLQVAQQASVRMEQLVSGLLAFSRLGRAELHEVAIDTAYVVSSVIEEFGNDCANRVVHWKVGPLPMLHGDPTLVRLVFQNLVGNALKFTRGRSETVIEIQPIEGLEDETGIMIRDNGAGFDPAYSHKLFGVFQRLHREDEFEGTGIGLANVHRIVVRHGGRVWAEGQPDQGAAFFIAFPVQGKKS